MDKFSRHEEQNWCEKMDSLMSEADRTVAIDQLRKDVLSRTSLIFLPRHNDHFMKSYSKLPGSKRMSTRHRIKTCFR
jgi:hypothetical protein